MYISIQTRVMLMVAITPGGLPPTGPVPGAGTMSFCPHRVLATRSVRLEDGWPLRFLLLHRYVCLLWRKALKASRVVFKRC